MDPLEVDCYDITDQSSAGKVQELLIDAGSLLSINIDRLEHQ